MPTRRSLLAAAALAIAAATFSPGLVAHSTQPTPPADTPAAPVRLTIDYHDGVEKSFTSLPHTKGMTVADALRLAAAHPRGIKIEHKGSGDTFFLVQIDDLKNQGAGKTALNWQYAVNGKPGSVGAGAAVLQPGDSVLWSFDIYKPTEAAPK